MFLASMFLDGKNGVECEAKNKNKKQYMYIYTQFLFKIFPKKVISLRNIDGFEPNKKEQIKNENPSQKVSRSKYMGALFPLLSCLL